MENLIDDPSLNYYPIDDTTQPNIQPSGNGSILKNGVLQSANFVFGISGWRFNSNGDIDYPIINGTTTFSSTSTKIINLGFKPRRIRIAATTNTGNQSQGGWNYNTGNKCIYNVSGGGAGAAVTGWRADEGAGANHQGVVTAITNTGFSLTNTKTGGPSTLQLFFEAE